MAVLTNTMMQGTAAISDDASGYQIEKSLRFEEADSANLTQTFSGTGNRKTWTFATWVKFTGDSNQADLWHARDGSGSPWTTFYLDSDFRLGITWTAGVNSNDFTPNRVYRDYNAWVHVVLAFDTTQSIESERIKMYVNGVLETEFAGTVYYPTQYQDVPYMNTNVAHSIGGTTSAASFYLADTQFIDGLQLSAAAFGSFDSNTGNWNPKAFALPAPNDATTWSSSLTSTGAFDDAATQAFNGLTSNGAKPDDNCTATFQPSSAISCSSEIRLHFSISGSGVVGDDVTINDIDKGPGIAAGWNTFNDIRSLEKITWKHRSGVIGFTLNAIEVDGVLLVDGQTDPTTRNNPNNGITWSTLGTSSGTWSNLANMFDGALLTGSSLGSGYAWANPGDWDLGSTNKITNVWKIRLDIWLSSSQAGDTNVVKINDTDVSGYLNGSTNTWQITDVTGSFTEFQKIWIANNDIYIKGIEVNGQWLTDGAVDNSFHLKFNDTTSNAALGKNTINGKIADATGGLPILNTTDDFGEVKGSGNRTDSLSGNLKLAIVGDSVSSTAMDVSSADHDVTVDAVTLSTDYSRFYGSSLKFVSSETDSLKITGESDFAFGTGDLCVEFWVYNTNNKNYNAFIATRSGGSTEDGWVIGSNASGYLYMHSNGALAGSYSGGHVLPLNQWTHVAYTRASGTHRLFMNGVATTTSTTSRDYTNDDIAIGTNPFNGEEVDAYMQDIRVYKGVAKYTSNFKPPAYKYLTVNNFIEKVGPSYSYPIVTKASVRSVFNGSRGANYTVEYSDNNSDWTVAFGGNMAASSCAWFDGTVTTGTNDGSYGGHQYWRYKIGSNTNSHHPNVNKVRFTDYSGTETVIATSGNADNCSDQGWGAGNLGEGTVKNHTYSSGNFPTEAAVDVDVFTDSPTNYIDDSDVVHGNYATLNPLKKSNSTLRQGNLLGGNTANTDGSSYSTIRCPSTGVWYCEATLKEWTAAGNNFGIGFDANEDSTIRGWNNSTGDRGWLFGMNETTVYKLHANSESNIGSRTTVAGDVVQMCYDADNGKLYCGINNSWIANSSSGASFDAANHTWTDATDLKLGGHFFLNAYDADAYINFGQRAWKYTPPLSAKALCTHNLDNTFSGDELNNPSKYFDVVKYVGDGQTTQNVKGIGFQPDLVWQKITNANGDHALTDVVRGTGAGYLQTEGTNVETGNDNDGVSAFLADGFTAKGGFNSNTNKWVSWLWDAGTAAATASTDGSETPTAQWVNNTAGFSITGWTVPSSGTYTVGHGLNAKPGLIIMKNRDAATNWDVYHHKVGATYRFKLNTADGQDSQSGAWNNAEPTNTVFTTNVSWQNAADKMVAYIWTPIEGYSSFGSYSGQSFVYTGFRPKYLLIKSTAGNNEWHTHTGDPVDISNPINIYTRPNVFNAEGTDSAIDFLANGFYPRTTGTWITDTTMIYIAFAEHPFKIARAA